jgi:phage-related protein
MPDYDLGKAHGSVEIDYDGSAVNRAKKDIDDLGRKSEDSGRKVRSSNDDMDHSYKELTGAIQQLTTALGQQQRASNSTDGSFRQLLTHVSNTDRQTRTAASGLNTFTGRTKLLAGGIAIAIPQVAGLAVSLVSLTGVAGVAVGALAAVGAAAATLAVGTAGISDVFKAAAADSKAAGSSAASSAKQQQSAARAIEDAKRSLARAEQNLQQVREEASRAAVQAERAIISAQRDLVNAQRDALRAQESLTRARAEATRQLEDMRLAITGGALDERQAILDIQQAQDDLNKTLADPTSTERDRAQAILNLEKQKQALEETRLANQRLAADSAVAAAKGVEGSDAVVSAQDQVRSSMQGIADAQQSLTDAQDAARQQQVDSARAIQDAVDGIADAQRSLADAYANAADAAAGGASKTADAMKNISPNARAVVKEVLGLKDAWQEVKFSVQDRLFAGLADDVKPLANIYFPLLKEGLGGIADGFNGIIKDVVEFLKTSEATDNIRQIFTNTGLAVKNLRTFVTDLLAAFLDIAAVGSDFLPEMATNASGAAAGFRDFVHEARESGKLKEWMQGGIDAVSKIWELLKNVGSIIKTVFSAFDQEGGGALNTLTKLTGQIDKFLKSAEGQDALHALGRILASIGGAYGKVFLSFLDAAAKILVALEPFITVFADAVGTYLAGAIQVALPVLKLFADVIGFLGPALGPVVAGIYAANKAVDAAKIVWKGLNAIMETNPFILIAAVIITLVLLIIQNWDTISAYLSGIWNDITAQATAIWTGIRDFFVGIWNDITTQFNAAITGIRDFFVGIARDISAQWNAFWRGLSEFFSGIGTDIKNQIGRFVDNVVGFFRDLPGKIWNFVKGLPDRFLSLGQDIVSGILRGLGNLASALWTKLKNAVSAAWDSVLDFFGISSPSKLAMYAGKMVGEGLAGGIEGSIGGVVKAAQNMAEAAAIAVPGFDPTSPSGMAFAAGTGRSQPVGLVTPQAVLPASATGTSGTTIVNVGTVTQQITGNLDPTKPVQWRSAMVSLKNGIRDVERDYA